MQYIFATLMLVGVLGLALVSRLLENKSTYVCAVLQLILVFYNQIKKMKELSVYGWINWFTFDSRQASETSI